MAGPVPVQDEGLEYSCYVLSQTVCDMLGCEVVFVELVRNELIRDSCLIQQTRCVCLLCLLCHIVCKNS